MRSTRSWRRRGRRNAARAVAPGGRTRWCPAWLSWPGAAAPSGAERAARPRAPPLVHAPPGLGGRAAPKIRQARLNSQVDGLGLGRLLPGEPEADLPGGSGADAGETGRQRLVQPARLLRQAQAEGLLPPHIRRQLILGGREGKGRARQHPPHPAHLIGHVAQAVDDLPVLHQAQVAVAAHGLKVELLLPLLPHLVQGLDVDADQPVSPHLRHPHHPAGHQVLAHEHAEHRRLLRALVAVPGQMHPGAGGVGVDEQAVVLPRGADKEQHHVLLRLLHPVYPAAPQPVIQFPGRKAQGQSVQRHSFSRFLPVSTR